MRKIRYKTLRIQNFLSVGNDSVEIDFQNGLNLITGKNIDNPERKNAVGKSVLIDAFYYALFGKTIRSIKQAFIINNVTKGDGKIELEFDVETLEGISSYHITRTLKPSAVSLKQGDTDLTNDSIANTNEDICQLIGSNSVICKSCDILSLSDNTPFMAKDAKDKRKFIEDIFALEIYGVMFEDLKKLIKANKADQSISSTKISEMVNTMDVFFKQKEETEKAIAEKDEILNKRKASLEEKISEYKKQLSEIPEVDITDHKEKITKLQDAEEKLDAHIATLNQKISDAKAERRTAENQIKSFDIGGIVSCDKCKQDIPHDHIETLEAQKAHFKSIYDNHQTDIDTFSEKGRGLNDKKDKIRQAVLSLSRTVAEVERSIDKKSSTERLIKELEESLENIESDVKENSGSIQIIEESLNDAKRRKDLEDIVFADFKQKGDDLDTCKFILGEEGVKAFVVKKLLGMLNASVQAYITELGMTMKCSFDEYFDEKITNDKGKEISYWNLSGGERRTVDLACAWAFKDIKRKISGISSNVEFCDEIFDSAFDERGLDLLIDVLKSRIDKYNMSIYAISHRKETMKHIDGEIVALEKENGVTRRVEEEL
jgi:DNA repair exonuclease SbcCD ATPase subunit